MPSGTSAGTDGGDDNSAGNDDDFAIRTASARRTAVKAGAAAAFDLDDIVGRSLFGRQRQRQRSTTRKPHDESKSDKPFHSFLPDLLVSPIHKISCPTYPRVRTA
jgi:hypothetical protein